MNTLRFIRDALLVSFGFAILNWWERPSTLRQSDDLSSNRKANRFQSLFHDRSI